MENQNKSKVDNNNSKNEIKQWHFDNSKRNLDTCKWNMCNTYKGWQYEHQSHSIDLSTLDPDLIKHKILDSIFFHISFQCFKKFERGLEGMQSGANSICSTYGAQSFHKVEILY